MKTPSTYRQGFTLLELLTAMGLLVIIVLMMSRVFTDTNRMWNLGTKRVTEAQEARVVVDFLAKELSTAIADNMISFKMHSETGPNSFSVRAYGEETDSLAFIAYTRTPPWGGADFGSTSEPGDAAARRRNTSQFIYYVDYMLDDDGNDMDENHDDGPRYRLTRLRKTRSSHTVSATPGSPAGINESAYKQADWWLPDLWMDQYAGFGGVNRETIAINLVAFELWAYTPSGANVWNFDSHTVGEPPLWVDIYLEVMGDAEITQLAAMWRQNHPDMLDYRERNARRYSVRIYLRNREGYAL